MVNGQGAYATREAPGYLFILTWPISRTGGVNEVVLALAERVRARGFRPVIAIASWNGDPQPASFRGIDVVSLRLREPASPDGARWHLKGFAATLPGDLRSFQRLLVRERIAVVNSHFPNLETVVPAMLKAMRRLRIPWVLSFHGADVVPMSHSTGWGRRLWHLVLSRADSITACSGALARDISTFFPAARVVAIHNGVDAESFHPAVFQASRNILNIGKFEHKKGQDVLLKAFRRMLDAGVDASLTLVGGEGPELPDIRKQIEDLQLCDRVMLHVNVPHEQIPGMMQQARMFVLSSRLEPFGIVLLEAGAARLPVVATEVGGVPELIDNECAGLLIPPDDEDALCRAMMRLWNDSDLAESVAGRWHERVRSRWSWDETANRYLQAAGVRS